MRSTFIGMSSAALTKLVTNAPPPLCATSATCGGFVIGPSASTIACVIRRPRTHASARSRHHVGQLLPSASTSATT